jgi:hypothetical protein
MAGVVVRQLRILASPFMSLRTGTRSEILSALTIYRCGNAKRASRFNYNLILIQKLIRLSLCKFEIDGF